MTAARVPKGSVGRSGHVKPGTPGGQRRGKDHMPRTVLVVDDQEDLARAIKLHLEDIRCDVSLAFDGLEAHRLIESREFDLVILDVMLPGMDGLEICRRVRSLARYVPVLMLTAKSSELDRVLGLEMGADDYLTKPFSVLELVARVKAIFRRTESLARQVAGAATLLRSGDVSIDVAKREVRLAELVLELTPKEFDLLLHLARHPGTVFTRSDLLDQVWGYRHSGYEHTVNSHINRLRAKVESDPANPRFVLTVWGVGYKFGMPVVEASPTRSP